MYRTEYTEKYCDGPNSPSDNPAEYNNFFNNPISEGEQQRKRLNEIYRQESLRDIEGKKSRILRRINTERVYSPSASLKPIRAYAIPVNDNIFQLERPPEKSILRKSTHDYSTPEISKKIDFTIDSPEYLNSDTNRPRANWSSAKHLDFREKQKLEWKEALQQQILEKQQRKQQETHKRIQEDKEDDRRVQREQSVSTPRSQINTQSPQIPTPHILPHHRETPPIKLLSAETTVRPLNIAPAHPFTPSLYYDQPASPRAHQQYPRDLLAQEASLTVIIGKIKQEAASPVKEPLTTLERLKDSPVYKSLVSIPPLPPRNNRTSSLRSFHIETTFLPAFSTTPGYANILDSIGSLKL